MNIILFDKNFEFVDMAWDQVNGGAETGSDVDHDYLMQEITVDELGYAFVYLSNENPTIVEVYFDDITLTHTPTNIVQYNEYYPFGLQTSNSWTREYTKGNNFLYNAGSELNATSGWYDLPYRNYDATLGRFLQVDPLAHADPFYTPFAYAGNNPVMYNDPMGLTRLFNPAASRNEWLEARGYPTSFGNTMGGPFGGGGGGSYGSSGIGISASEYYVRTGNFDAAVNASSTGATSFSSHGGGGFSQSNFTTTPMYKWNSNGGEEISRKIGGDQNRDVFISYSGAWEFAGFGLGPDDFYFYSQANEGAAYEKMLELQKRYKVEIAAFLINHPTKGKGVLILPWVGHSGGPNRHGTVKESKYRQANLVADYIDFYAGALIYGIIHTHWTSNIEAHLPSMGDIEAAREVSKWGINAYMITDFNYVKIDFNKSRNAQVVKDFYPSQSSLLND